MPFAEFLVNQARILLFVFRVNAIRDAPLRKLWIQLCLYLKHSSLTFTSNGVLINLRDHLRVELYFF